MYNSMSTQFFAPLLMVSLPHDVWMALWKAYGNPCVPPFPKDILHPVAPVMVPSTPDEITPPIVPIAPTDPIPTIDALDLVQ